MRQRQLILAILSFFILGITAAPAQKREADKGPPKEPKEFVEWVIKAHGGEAKLAKSNMMTRKMFCGIEWPDVGLVPFYLHNTWVMPDKYRIVFQTPQLDAKGNWNDATIQWNQRESVLNGDKAWQSFNGQAKEMTGGELAAFKEQAYAENLCRLLPLRESRYELTMLDDVEFESRTLVGMSVSCKDHKPVNLYFDKKTGLLTKMQHPVMHGDTRFTNQDVIFREYTDTTGPKHWRRITVITEGGKTFEGEIMEVTFPAKIGDEFFALPKAKTEKEKDKK